MRNYQDKETVEANRISTENSLYTACIAHINTPNSITARRLKNASESRHYWHNVVQIKKGE